MVSESDIRQSLLKMTASAVFSFDNFVHSFRSKYFQQRILFESFDLRIYKPL